MPNVKLKVDSFKATRGSMEILGDILINVTSGEGDKYNTYGGAFYKSSTVGWGLFFNGSGGGGYNTAKFKASRTWSGESSSASPYTETLGSGTALSIQPVYITLKFWKRLS